MRKTSVMQELTSILSVDIKIEFQAHQYTPNQTSTIKN